MFILLKIVSYDLNGRVKKCLISTNLKNHLIARWEIIDRRASNFASLKTGLEMPENLYSLEQVLDENFLPQ
ncbi:MAG: hypothetical protein ACRC2R_01915 [Xenococcaceae cyanobacterium]